MKINNIEKPIIGKLYAAKYFEPKYQKIVEVILFLYKTSESENIITFHFYSLDKKKKIKSTYDIRYQEDIDYINKKYKLLS